MPWIGEPTERLLRRAGLPSTCLDDPKTSVPSASRWRFRELAAIRTGLPIITLTVMEPYGLADLGTLGLLTVGLMCRHRPENVALVGEDVFGIKA